MKKRRILVGLALASAALFSLAACGKTEEPTPTPTPTPSETSTPVSDKVNVKFVAKFSDGAADQELTALAKEVEKNTKVTKPEDPVKEGYVFKGFKNKTTHMPFDFNANITKNTEVVAYFYKPTTYDTFAASENKVMAYDFEDMTIGQEIPAYDSSKTGVSNNEGADAELYGATVVVSNYHNYLKTYDKGNAQTKVVFNVKDAIENSTIKVYTKFKLDGTMGSNWPFFEVLTNNGTETVAAYGFGGDGSKKFGYRVNEGDYYNYKDELLAADTEYEALFEVNTDTKEIKLTLNGEAQATVTANFDNVVGFRFVTGGSAGTYTGHSDERFIVIDQFAVTAVANDIATVKAAGKAAVKAVYDAFVESDKDAELTPAEWQPVLDAYNAAYTETTGTIDAATTAAEVKTARDAAITAIGAAVDSLRDAKADELTTLLKHKGNTGCWYWTGDALTNYNNGTDAEKTAYDTALDELKDTYLAQLGDVENVKDGYALLAEFITEANIIVKEKVDVTVKYYEKSFVEATGITAFESGVTYYTKDDVYVESKLHSNSDASKCDYFATGVTYYKKDGDNYVVYDTVNNTRAEAGGVVYYTKGFKFNAVDSNTAYDSNKTYYTKNIIEITASETSYKTVKDETTSKDKISVPSNYAIKEIYSNSSLTTAFDFTANITAATTVHVLLNKVSALYFDANSSAVGSLTDYQNYTLGENIHYLAKNGSSVVENPNADLTTLNGKTLTHGLKITGESDSARNYVEIDLTTAIASKATIKVYLAGYPSNGNKLCYLLTTPNKYSTDDAVAAAEASGEIISKTTSSLTSVVELKAENLDVASRYFFCTKKCVVYAIEIIYEV